jgi:hypothetical protein
MARGTPPRAVLFLARLAGTAFQQELPTAKTVLIKSSCPLHDADPPPTHHSNDVPGARLLFRIVHIVARLYHVAKTLGGLCTI